MLCCKMANVAACCASLDAAAASEATATAAAKLLLLLRHTIRHLLPRHQCAMPVPCPNKTSPTSHTAKLTGLFGPGEQNPNTTAQCCRMAMPLEPPICTPQSKALGPLPSAAGSQPIALPVRHNAKSHRPTTDVLRGTACPPTACLCRHNSAPHSAAVAAATIRLHSRTQCNLNRCDATQINPHPCPALCPHACID